MGVDTCAGMVPSALDNYLKKQSSGPNKGNAKAKGKGKSLGKSRAMWDNSTVPSPSHFERELARLEESVHAARKHAESKQSRSCPPQPPAPIAGSAHSSRERPKTARPLCASETS